MNRRLFVVLLVATVAKLTLADAANHSRSSYEIQVPDDWIEVPQAELHTLTGQVLSDQGRKSVHFDRAFQQRDSERWFEYPYVIVQVLQYRDLGYESQPSQTQISSIVQAITGSDPNDTVKRALSDDARAPCIQI